MATITLEYLAGLAEQCVRTIATTFEIARPMLFYTSDGKTIGSMFFDGKSDYFNAEVARMFCHQEKAIAAVLLYEAKGAIFASSDMASNPLFREVLDGKRPPEDIPVDLWREYVVIIGDNEEGRRLNRAFIVEGKPETGRSFVPMEDIYEEQHAPYWPMVNTHQHFNQFAVVTYMVTHGHKMHAIKDKDPEELLQWLEGLRSVSA